MSKKNGALFPQSQFDDEELSRFKNGDNLIVTIEQEKDIRLERFWFALTGKVAKAVGQDPDVLRFRIKVKAGKVKYVVIDGEEAQLVPHSVSDMNQAELSELVDFATNYVTTELLPGASVEQIMNEEVLPYLGERAL